MSSVKIVTDSHSSITREEALKYNIDVLPTPFRIGDKDYYEGLDLTRDDFFKMLSEGLDVSTSQPAPTDVMGIWDKALKEHDSVLYMPISSGLSSSCATATMLSQEEKYQGRVFVVDHGRIATPLLRYLIDAAEMVKDGMSAPDIKDVLEREREKMCIYLALDTLEYLKKGGRISAASAVLGTALDIKPVLTLHTGMLSLHRKCRGIKKAKKTMIELIKNDFETKFKDDLERGDLHLLAATAASEDVTNEWIEEIKEAFPGMDVMCAPLSLGVCCHTGEGALGIGCSCKPYREK